MTSTKPTAAREFDYHRIASRHSKPKPWLPLTGKEVGLVLFSCVIAFACVSEKTTPTLDPVAIQGQESPLQTEVSANVENATGNPGSAVDSQPASLSTPRATGDDYNALEAGKVSMAMDDSGRFIAAGEINGKPILFHADTGASLVVIPEKTARRIGLAKGEPVSVNTLAGPAIHYLTTVETLNLGAIVLRNVTAIIAPDMADDSILLGMNVLAGLHMKMDKQGMELSVKDVQTAHAPVGDKPESRPLKRPLSQCMKPGNQFDRNTLECLQGIS